MTPKKGVRVFSPCLKKSRILNVGDVVKYYNEGIHFTGKILEIWGHSFKVECGKTWIHLYPSDLIWEDAKRV